MDIKKLARLTDCDLNKFDVELMVELSGMAFNEFEDKWKEACAELQPKTGRIIDADYTGKHWRVDEFGDVKGRFVVCHKCVIYSPIFYDKESAEQHKRWLELDHKYRVAMAESWGGEKVDWEDGGQKKWCVTIDGKNVDVRIYYVFKPYHFKTKEDAQDFLDSITLEEAKLLIMGVQ